MKKIIRIVVIFIAVLLTLIIVLPIVFKDKIAEKVKSVANENVNAKIEWGEFDLSLLSTFPNFKFEIHDVKVAGADEFQGVNLADIGTLRLDLGLMSVINGESPQINGLSLDKAHIYLKVLKGGKANWDIALPSEETVPAEPAPASEEPSAPFTMNLDHYELTESSFIYDDADLPYVLKLEGLNHTGNGSFSTGVSDLVTHSDIKNIYMSYDGVGYIENAHALIDATISMDLEKFSFGFKENKILINGLPLHLDGTIDMPNDMIFDLKFASTDAQFKSLLSLIPSAYSEDMAGIKTSGTFSLDGYMKGVYSDEAMPGFGIHLDVKDGKVQYPDLPKAIENINITMAVDDPDGVPDHTVVDLKKFHMEAGGQTLDMNLHVTTPESNANVRGAIHSNMDLSKIHEFAPLPDGESINGKVKANLDFAAQYLDIEKENFDKIKADGALEINDMVYKSAAAPDPVEISSMIMQFSPQKVNLKEAKIKTGKSDIEMDGVFDNLYAFAMSDETLKGVFNLRSNYLDLNPFMPEETESSEAPATAEAETGSKNEGENKTAEAKKTADASTPPAPAPEPLIPSNVDVVFNADLKKVKYEDMDINNIKGNMKVKDGILNFDNTSMQTLGGTIGIDGDFDASKAEKPAVDLKLSIKKLDIAQAYKNFMTIEKFAPIAKYTSGTFSTDLSFATDLTSDLDPIMESVGGGGKLLAEALTIEKAGVIDKLASQLKTSKFDNLKVGKTWFDFVFEDGKLKVRPFKVKLGDIQSTVQGENAFNGDVNYTMAMKIPRKKMGGAANSLIDGLIAEANNKGANISAGEYILMDALITGPVKDPKVKVRPTGMSGGDAKESVKQSVKKEVDKKVQEAKDKAKEELEKQKEAARKKAEEEKKKLEAEKKRVEEEARKKAEEEKKKAADKLKEEADKKKEDLKNKLKGFGK